MLEIFEQYLAEEGIEFQGVQHEQIMWNGGILKVLTDEIWQLVLWELLELNFHCELFALDMRANPWRSD